MNRAQAVAFWEEAQYAGYYGLSVKLVSREAAILKFDQNKEGNCEMVELCDIAKKHNIVINYVTVYGLAFRDREDWLASREKKAKREAQDV